MEQRDILSAGQAGSPGLTPAEIRKRLAARAVSAARGDAETARVLAGAPLEVEAVDTAERTIIPAAVLVPLVEHADGLHVLLTLRTAHLDHHAGQISFPGGRMEPEDADAVAAALREANEEIGIEPPQVEILGRLDDYVTITGFRVTPVVALLHQPYTLRPDPFEVADVFEVPLAFLLDRANHQRHFRENPDGMRRYFYAMPYGERYIWGATAAMLVNFWEALGSP